MGIVSVEYRPDNRSKSVDLVSARARNTESYTVITNDPSDGPGICLTADAFEAGMPRKGQVHPDGDGSYVQGYDIRQLDPGDGGYMYLVVVTYDSRQHEGVTQPQEPHPLLRTPQWGFSVISKTRRVKSTHTGKPIVNSAGLPFTDGVEIPEFNLQFTYSANVRPNDFDLGKATHVIGALNRDTLRFLSFSTGPRTALCVAHIPDHSFEAGIEYLRVTTSFILSDDFDQRLLDQGELERIEDNGKVFYRPYVNKDGDVVGGSHLLDGNGMFIRDVAPIPKYIGPIEAIRQADLSGLVPVTQ